MWGWYGGCTGGQDLPLGWLLDSALQGLGGKGGFLGTIYYLEVLGLVLCAIVLVAGRLDGGLQDSASQHQCPCDKTSSQKWLSPASVHLTGVPSVFCSLGDFHEISQWNLTQAVFQSLLLLRACDILHVSLKNWISVSHSPLAFPCKPCLPSKPDDLVAHLCDVVPPE